MFLFVSRIPGDLCAWFGALGYLLLMFAPGAWTTFGLTLDGIPFWAKLSTAAMLSPLMVCAEFFAMRLIGIPFGPTAVTLVFLNLPAIYLIWKRRVKVASPPISDWLVGVAAVVIPVICMISLLIHTDARIYSAHSWVHADAVYMFARGDLALEDPTLAGFRMSWPVWSALPFQAVHSFLVDSPPMSCYVWSNLLWLIATCSFSVGITREMGGGKLAQFGSGIWLLVGTNPVGYILAKLVPGGMSHYLWGDPRYTPWVVKFLLSGPMALALGMTMAMIYLLVRSGPLTKQVLIIICLLLSGIGLLYPLLFPPACGIIAAKALALVTEKHSGRWTILYREWSVLAGLLLVALLVTHSEVKFLTADRLVSTSPVVLSTLPSVARKMLESLIATSLLLAGVALTIRGCWKSKRAATALLLGGALGSYVLHAAFHIPFYENEYKFIFPIAMCLAVFPAIAVEQIWREWPRGKAVPVLTGIVLLLLGTYGHWAYVNWPAPWLAPWLLPKPLKFEMTYDPPLDVSEFYLKLNQRDPWSGICNAVRRMTPADSILVLDNGAFYYPALTARSLYVSPINRNYPGVNLGADDIDADLRGYGRQILEQRRATMADFFDARDDSRREQALNVMLTLKRPIAIVAEPRHTDLQEWLKHRETAVQLYAENGLSLWLIDRTSRVWK